VKYSWVVTCVTVIRNARSLDAYRGYVVLRCQRVDFLRLSLRLILSNSLAAVVDESVVDVKWSDITLDDTVTDSIGGKLNASRRERKALMAAMELNAAESLLYELSKQTKVQQRLATYDRLVKYV
jgi:hypothetical protein